MSGETDHVFSYPTIASGQAPTNAICHFHIIEDGRIYAAFVYSVFNDKSGLSIALTAAPALHTFLGVEPLSEVESEAIVATLAIARSGKPCGPSHVRAKSRHPVWSSGAARLTLCVYNTLSKVLIPFSATRPRNLCSWEVKGEYSSYYAASYAGKTVFMTFAISQPWLQSLVGVQGTSP